ncbi:hypothetical protein [Levilactobacillus angrenensis]|uniref:Uncharacterized protein n=1 Tax=Levilactobacillus angrenensis TaxID=2486020 RepID=A0ABW1U8N3_9LACO|nr:hypothetical protein [Levilactobacillus angrenensis]
MNRFVTGSIALTSLSLALLCTPTSAQASSWHTSAIPAKLRGRWYARNNHSQGVRIHKHTIRYSGEKSTRVKWRYVGHKSYRFKSTHSSDLIHLKY